jgi:nucleotide-binding universal stress UspA family protein
MKILLAADGSPFTKKALAFLVTHEGLAGPNDELVVLHVQPPVPPRVKTMVGAAAVADYHRQEADKVLEPINAFLANHSIPFRCSTVIGPPADEIVRHAASEKAQMIVMGTHGYGLLGRFFMGSVAQQVVAQADIPVLLVK